jgi:PAS domain S-box-containing protein
VVGVGVIAQLFAMVVERERLNAAERRFRALLDEASEAIRIVEPATWRILETNRADSALSGYPRQALLGRDGHDFWPQDPEERSRWQTLLKETAAQGSASAFGLAYQAAEGLRAIDLTCRRVHHDGRPYDIVIFRDAAPREALDAAHREVLDLRAVTLVANAAAHEINNPLTVIVGSLELLHRRVLGDAQGEKWVDRAVVSAERIRDIIARMTHITRLSPAESAPGVPAMLDIRRSSEDN